MGTSTEANAVDRALACQVVVVGGGPAGSAAAHAAASRGLDVVLLERGAVNRDKSCGDMFMPSAVAILECLGVDCPGLLADEAVSSFNAVGLHGARGLLWTVAYPHEPVWVMPRRVIDQVLRDLLAPRARVLYSASVGEIAERPGGRLRVRAARPCREVALIDCEAVILACGAQDRLTSRWGVSGQGEIAPSISTYVSNPNVEIPRFEFSSACRPGYRWVFPSPRGGANIGVCSLAHANGSPLRKLGRDLLDAYQLPREVRWRGGAGSLWSGQGSCWHHPAGVVSCGDAAGLVDPINGEGLTAALTSGQAAGAAIAEFLLRNRKASSLREYSGWVASTFGARYARSPDRLAWKQLCGIGSVRN
jgi:flavin-dependent dehydrogenase